jgi:hypothetical protein
VQAALSSSSARSKVDSPHGRVVQQCDNDEDEHRNQEDKPQGV